MDVFFKDEHTFIKEFKLRIKKRYIIRLEDASIRQKYNVLGEMVSEVIADNWLSTKEYLNKNNLKEIHYFSMEFLMGRLITNNIMNLGLRNIIEKGFNLDNYLKYYKNDKINNIVSEISNVSSNGERLKIIDNLDSINIL